VTHDRAITTAGGAGRRRRQSRHRAVIRRRGDIRRPGPGNTRFHRQPIGFGRSIPRQIARLVGAAICCTGFVFPLWDARRQTLADKIMTTVWLPIF
jgi:hypothetical protein